MEAAVAAEDDDEEDAEMPAPGGAYAVALTALVGGEDGLAGVLAARAWDLDLGSRRSSGVCRPRGPVFVEGA
jgi:hypothetical protein